MLHEDGYEVEVVTDGMDAIERLGRAPTPDVLLVDFLLPRADGLEVASRGRARRPSLPVLMITSYPEVVARLDRRLDPPSAVLPKPLIYGELTRELERLRATP